MADNLECRRTSILKARGGNKRLSIILITWNQCETTRDCLNTLVPAVDPNRDEIIVIDNGSIDETAEIIPAEFPSVLYCRVPRNLGVGPARNRGLGWSSGRYVMVLDNDTLVPSGVSLGQIVEEVFERHGDVGLFGFGLLNPDGTHQRSARRFPTLLHPVASRIPGATIIPFFKRLMDEHLMEDVNFQTVEELKEVDFVLGANQIFRREILAQVGAYDPSIFYGGEDFDLCYRIRRAGWRIAWCPKIRIVHVHRRITRKLSKTTFRFIYAYICIFAKYRSIWRLPHAG